VVAIQNYGRQQRSFLKRTMTSRNKYILFWLGSGVYTLPFLLSLSLPSAYWDWLMTPGYQLRNNAFSWVELTNNIIFTFF
jgi:hypothetical protein